MRNVRESRGLDGKSAGGFVYKKFLGKKCMLHNLKPRSSVSTYMRVNSVGGAPDGPDDGIAIRTLYGFMFH